MDKSTTGGKSDHDLLVEISTKVERAINDIADLGNNFTGRIRDLEMEKLDKEDFEENKVSVKEITDDHELRLRRAERYMWGAIGAIGFIQALVTIYLTIHR